MADLAYKKRRSKQAVSEDVSSQVIDGGFGNKRPLFGYDWPLVAGIILILVFGLLMLYSASSYTSLVSTGSSYYYVKKQIFATLVGLVAMVVVSFIPMNFWKYASIPIFAVAVGLIFLVNTSLGVESNGARRWLNIGGFSLQPSEVLKFAFILIMAFILARFIKYVDKFWAYILIFIFGVISPALVILVTDDLGTAIIFFGILLVMLFVCCRKLRYIVFSVIVVAAAAIYFIMSEDYRRERILAWINIEDYADDEGYQIIQGLYAIGSGGFFGKGIGKSTQKLSFVPEAENDMIFSIICEELGFFGVLILVLLYGVIIWRMMKIFNRTMDLFSRLVVAGVASHIGIQALVNMCVVTNLFPNTGVPLPFISYGGTSSVILLAEIGLVLAACRKKT